MYFKKTNAEWFDKIVGLLKGLDHLLKEENEMGIKDAPIEMNNCEASAWCQGSNAFREKLKELIMGI